MTFAIAAVSGTVLFGLFTVAKVRQPKGGRHRLEV